MAAELRKDVGVYGRLLFGRWFKGMTSSGGLILTVAGAYLEQPILRVLLVGTAMLLLLTSGFFVWRDERRKLAAALAAPAATPAIPTIHKAPVDPLREARRAEFERQIQQLDGRAQELLRNLILDGEIAHISAQSAIITRRTTLLVHDGSDVRPNPVYRDFLIEWVAKKAS